MRSACLVLAVAAAMPAAAAPPGVASRHENAMAAEVINQLERQDCVAAVRAVNDGMAKGYATAWLQSGAMYEEGLCVKRSWARAAGLYQRAHEAGHGDGLPRLVAGHAAPGPDQDKAAALWWASQSRQPLMPQPCLSAARHVPDPDAFVQALQSWSPAQLEACVYIAGVMGAMAGDVEFPARAVFHGVSGKVRAVFSPAVARIDVEPMEVTVEGPRGFATSDKVFDSQTRSVKGSLTAHVREAATRALARYPRPEAIDPAWQVRFDFTFFFVD